MIISKKRNEKMENEKNICPGCGKIKTSIKASKLTKKPLCGICRIEEYQELKAECYADKYISDNFIWGC